MSPLNLFAGPYDWIILAVVVLVLFGGTKLAGFGKNAGRAIREFKEETSALKQTDPPPPAVGTGEPTVHEAEIVEDPKKDKGQPA